MKKVLLLSVASVSALALAAGGSAQPKTTAPGGYFTVRLTVTDTGVTLKPSHAPRGSTAVFLLSNRGSASRVLTVGDATLKRRRGTGFAVTLDRNQQKRVLQYLTYRGLLPVSLGDAGKSKVVGVFSVTSAAASRSAAVRISAAARPAACCSSDRPCRS